MKLCFDDIVIDGDRHELSCSGELVHVEPKVFRLLTYLAENPHRLIGMDELLQSVWNGRIVSDTTVAGCIKHARRVIGDNGNTQALIKTVRGHGFRFCAEVSRVDATIVQGGMTPPTESNGIGQIANNAWSFNPTLAIQTFEAYSDRPEMKYFVHGLSLALTGALSRIPLLRLSPLLTDSRALTPREVHEALGCDYCLTGSVEILHSHIRIMVQLCDARAGFSLWSQQFQIPGALISAHDPSVLAIVAKLEPQLHLAMYNTVLSSGTVPNALELYLQASGLLALQGWHHDSFLKASDLLRKSWQQEPGFAHASSYLSLVLGLGHRLGLMPNEAHVREEALTAAERSLELETMDSSILGLAGCALGDLGHEVRALSILKRAVELNPGNAQAWSALGSVELSQRRVQDAIEHLSHGIDLSPHDSRLSVWGGVLATALRVEGKLDDAMICAKLACERDDRTYMPRVVLAGVCLAADEGSGAQAAMADAYRIKPDLTGKQVGYLVGKRLAGELMQSASAMSG